MTTQSMTLSGKGLTITIDEKGFTCNCEKMGKVILDSVDPVEGYEPDLISYIGKQIKSKYQYFRVIDKKTVPDVLDLIY